MVNELDEKTGEKTGEKIGEKMYLGLIDEMMSG